MQATIKINNIAPEQIEELEAASLMAIFGGDQPTTKSNFAYDAAYTVYTFILGVVAGYNQAAAAN